MGRLLPSLRYTLRLLLKSPGFTITAVLVLGFGIGVNTAIFSLIDNVLLKPLPFPDPDRLVQITEPCQNNMGTNVDYPDYADIALGLAMGLITALLLVRFIEGALYGISTNDPIALSLAVVILGIAAVFACLLPAMRAIRTNPITALRE